MENSQEQKFIFVKPEFLDHWSYQIDNGKRHLLREDDVYPYVKRFLKDSKEWAKVVDIIRRHQPFIVSFEKRICKELHPIEETKEEHRQVIAKDLSNMMNTLEGEGTVLQERQGRQLRFSDKKEDGIDRTLRDRIRSLIKKEEPEISSRSRIR